MIPDPPPDLGVRWWVTVRGRLARFRGTALGVLLIASIAWLQACGGGNTGGGGGTRGGGGTGGTAGAEGGGGGSGTSGGGGAGGGAGGDGNGGGAGACGGAGGDLDGGGASCTPCGKADACCNQVTAFIGVSSVSCRYFTNCEAKSGCDRDQYIATCIQTVLDSAQIAPQLPACQ